MSGGLEAVVLTIGGVAYPAIRFTLRLSRAEGISLEQQQLTVQVSNQPGRLDILRAAIGGPVVLKNVVTFPDGGYTERPIIQDVALSSITGSATDRALDLIASGAAIPATWYGTLAGVIYIRATDGRLRVRSQGVTELKPGDVVTVNGLTFTAESVTIYGSIGGMFSEVTE